jgi:hypothetical protein
MRVIAQISGSKRARRRESFNNTRDPDMRRLSTIRVIFDIASRAQEKQNAMRVKFEGAIRYFVPFANHWIVIRKEKEKKKKRYKFNGRHGTVWSGGRKWKWKH